MVPERPAKAGADHARVEEHIHQLGVRRPAAQLVVAEHDAHLDLQRPHGTVITSVLRCRSHRRFGMRDGFAGLRTSSNAAPAVTHDLPGLLGATSDHLAR